MARSSAMSELRLAELALNPQIMFVLWAIKAHFCTSVSAFHLHFGANFPDQEMLNVLRDAEVLEGEDEKLRLTDLGDQLLSGFDINWDESQGQSVHIDSRHEVLVSPASPASLQMFEDVLSQVPSFHDLTKHELQVLSLHCRERDYPAGATLLHQGETGIGLFIITNGKVQITQQAPDGSDRDLGTFERGTVLGEMSLLDDMPRTATAVALEPTRALVIPVWDFRAALREQPEIAMKLLATLSRRMRHKELHQDVS
jgi:CRP/FNR family transcriptional regulator, cyclic AMP receptor protein